MLIEFHDGEKRAVHAKFQAWRRNYPDGFFLTFGSKRRARLHTTQCLHSGDMHWTAKQFGQSLTTERKMCAETQERLLRWAVRAEVQVARCADCLRRMPVPTEGDLNADALTAYSWGYWGWGNSVPQFLQAATALESARGFDSPAFADVRLSRSVRAPGFNGKALENLVGSSRYRWFKGLGNDNIATGKSGVKIADPPEAHALLDFVKEQAVDGRRVLFFCACEVGHPCHRRTVATLLLSAARVRRVDLTIIEWPGGDPDVRELRLKTDRERRASGKTIPLGQRMPTDGSATLPWGSTVMVRRGDEVQQVLTGPAIFKNEWRLPRLSVPGASEKAKPAAQARKLRAMWRCGPRRSRARS